MTGAALALLTSFTALAAPARPKRVAFLFAGANGAGVLVKRLTRAVGNEASVSIYDLDAGGMSDPRRKGRLLADLQAGDLVVAIGDRATNVASSLIPGNRLASPWVSGVLSLNVDRLLDAVQGAGWRELAFIYTPGYETVARWLREGASRRGLSLAERRVPDLSALPQAARDVFGRTRAVWLAGDPLLVRGAAFEYLRERSLAHGVPLIADGASEVQRGALLGYSPAPNSLADKALSGIESILRDGFSKDLQAAPPDGELLVNAVLAERWRFRAPPGRPSRSLH